MKTLMILGASIFIASCHQSATGERYNDGEYRGEVETAEGTVEGRRTQASSGGSDTFIGDSSGGERCIPGGSGGEDCYDSSTGYVVRDGFKEGDTGTDISGGLMDSGEVDTTGYDGEYPVDNCSKANSEDFPECNDSGWSEEDVPGDGTGTLHGDDDSEVTDVVETDTGSGEGGIDTASSTGWTIICSDDSSGDTCSGSTDGTESEGGAGLPYIDTSCGYGDTETESGCRGDSEEETESSDSENGTDSNSEDTEGSICDGYDEDGTWCDETNEIVWHIEVMLSIDWVDAYNTCLWNGMRLPNYTEGSSLRRDLTHLCFWDESIFGTACYEIWLYDGGPLPPSKQQTFDALHGGLNFQNYLKQKYAFCVEDI